MITALLAAEGVAKLGAAVGAVNKLFTNMIVAAALIEGVALFAAVIAFLCI